MNGPSSMGGLAPAGMPQQWAPTAAYPGQAGYGYPEQQSQPYPGQQYPGQPYPGQPYPGQQYQGQQFAAPAYPEQQQFAAPAYPEQQQFAAPAYPEQQYLDHGYAGQLSPAGPGTVPGMSPYQDSWAASTQHVPPAAQAAGPLAPAAEPRPSTAKLVAFVIAGFVVLGLLGGGLLMIAADSTTNQAAPAGVSQPAAGGAQPVAGGGQPAAGPGTAATSVTMPTTIDGTRQIDNPAAKRLMETLRQQLTTAGSDNAVVGLYGQPGRPTPDFLVAASTTSYDSQLLITGLEAGMQQSAGTQKIEFVDQPAGPLGGTMRCADGQQFSVCIWAGEGVFGMNMVYGQNLAQASATTLRVRDAVEIHAN